jgi:Tol biopolymer transport system component
MHTPGGTRPATQSPFAKVTRVTPKDNGVNTWPDLSPDNRQVAYVRENKPTEGPDIWVMPVQGGEPQNLTGDGNDVIEAAPEWSPDGKQIAFHAAEKGAKSSDIYMMDASGKNKKKLVEGGGDNIRPHWSPDGKYIAFSSTRTNKWEVFIVEVATGTIFQVTQTPATTICTAWGA